MNVLYIIDIDGCIADASARFKEAGPEPLRSDRHAYDEWLGKVQTKESLHRDKPVSGMMEMVWALYKSGDAVFVTAREAKWRLVTQNWLDRYEFPALDLYMRMDGSLEEAHEFKQRTIKNIVHDLNRQTRDGVDRVVVIDDDPSGMLEEVCRKEYWTFLKARSGS